TLKGVDSAGHLLRERLRSPAPETRHTTSKMEAILTREIRLGFIIMFEVGSPRSQLQDFTLAQLRTFATVAQAGSFVRAAERLGISQPAVSEQIKLLEDCLNRRLFDRRRGAQPRLTDEGEDVLRSATSILNACDGLLGLHGKVADKSIGLRVSIG